MIGAGSWFLRISRIEFWMEEDVEVMMVES